MLPYSAPFVLATDGQTQERNGFSFEHPLASNVIALMCRTVDPALSSKDSAAGDMRGSQEAPAVSGVKENVVVITIVTIPNYAYRLGL